jgi:hypothetical protein
MIKKIRDLKPNDYIKVAEDNDFVIMKVIAIGGYSLVLQYIKGTEDGGKPITDVDVEFTVVDFDEFEENLSDINVISEKEAVCDSL